MKFKDYYDVMGISRDATQDEIKRAYRKLARKFHPDVSDEAEAEERFKEVGEAYEVLKDPEKRAAYDQLGKNWQAGQDFRPPPDWDQGFEFHGGNFTGADAHEFSDFFEGLFGHNAAGDAFHRGGGLHGRGEDSHAKISIDLEDAYQGVTRILTLKHTELGADGRPVIRERKLNVRIPKGVHQGQQIRLSGQGSPGIGSGEAGDLYLEIEFHPHPLYRTEGRDLYLKLPVAPWEAALGTSVRVPSPSGAVEMKIPPNSSGGSKLRLKGRGIPGATPGDLYVELQIDVPAAESAAVKEAYQALAQAADYDPRAHMGV